MATQSISRHTWRQLRFVIPGTAATYFLDSPRILSELWQDPRAWKSTAFSLGVLGIVILLFVYLLVVPWRTRRRVNYANWRSSRILSTLIPVLSIALVVGWTSLAVTLAKPGNAGYLKGALGASGIYALTFGLMGLIPAPSQVKVSRANSDPASSKQSPRK